MKREIKTTLAIDGEKAFNSAMSEAAREMRVLASESKATTTSFGDNAKSIDALRAKNTVLSKQISQQEDIVRALSEAVKDSAAAYGENSSKTDAYRIKLNNATAALNKMKTETQKNESAIRAMQDEASSGRWTSSCGFSNQPDPLQAAL